MNAWRFTTGWNSYFLHIAKILMVLERDSSYWSSFSSLVARHFTAISLGERALWNMFLVATVQLVRQEPSSSSLIRLQMSDHSNKQYWRLRNPFLKTTRGLSVEDNDISLMSGALISWKVETFWKSSFRLLRTFDAWMDVNSSLSFTSVGERRSSWLRGNKRLRLLTLSGPSPGEPAPRRMQAVRHLPTHLSACLDFGRRILAPFLSSPVQLLQSVIRSKSRKTLIRRNAERPARTHPTASAAEEAKTTYGGGQPRWRRAYYCSRCCSRPCSTAAAGAWRR